MSRDFLVFVGLLFVALNGNEVFLIKYTPNIHLIEVVGFHWLPDQS